MEVLRGGGDPTAALTIDVAHLGVPHLDVPHLGVAQWEQKARFSTIIVRFSLIIGNFGGKWDATKSDQSRGVNRKHRI